MSLVGTRPPTLDEWENASCTYTAILSAVGAIYHALLYTGK